MTARKKQLEKALSKALKVNIQKRKATGRVRVPRPVVNEGGQSGHIIR